ncbi:hypothetical protein FJZ23_03375 [Candidatus Parcubacteria bacterium]|nr:hypothetical protein [Candidatus Parcubacteria bacterium]
MPLHKESPFAREASIDAPAVIVGARLVGRADEDAQDLLRLAQGRCELYIQFQIGGDLGLADVEWPDSRLLGAYVGAQGRIGRAGGKKEEAQLF